MREAIAGAEAQTVSVATGERVAPMLRADFAAAGESWLADAGADVAERVKREGSDFLQAEDHDSRIIDFYAPGHTCGAWAAMAGASPKAPQTLDISAPTNAAPHHSGRSVSSI